MRVLVTGSSGFIARFLVPSLAAKGDTVVGLDKRVGPEFGGSYSFIHGNILDADAVDTAMRGVGVVFHLAAEHKDFGVPDRLFHQVNVEGTANLLKFAIKYDVRKFVFLSSVAVYGNRLMPSHEDLPPAPESPYGRTKLLAERCIEEWAQGGDNREAIIVRPTVVFGPYNYANMYRLIEAVARRRYVGVGKGANIKSVAYVENLVAATLFLCARSCPGLQLINYADVPHLTTRELVQSIAANLKVPMPRVVIPRSLALACTLPFDLLAAVTRKDLPLTAKRIGKFTNPTHHLAEKIRSLGYQADLDLHEGIRRTVMWYLKTRQKPDLEFGASAFNRAE